MQQTPLERAREFFKDDVYATGTTGITIDDIGDGYAKCSLTVTPAHLNAANTVMGGAIYTLADFAFAVASNYEHPLTVTLSSNITFLNAAKGKKITAVARLYSEGGHTCSYNIEITDELGTNVALVTSNGYKTNRPSPF